MMAMMNDGRDKHPPFAPPFLKAGKLVIAQVANILFYLGPRLKLAPRDEAGAPLAASVTADRCRFRKGNSRHASSCRLGPLLRRSETRSDPLRREFSRRAGTEISSAILKTCSRRAGVHILPAVRSPMSILSIFQLIEGLRYAFPRAMKDIERKTFGLVALRDRVAERPGIKAYLACPATDSVQQNGDLPALRRAGPVGQARCRATLTLGWKSFSTGCYGLCRYEYESNHAGF